MWGARSVRYGPGRAASTPPDATGRTQPAGSFFLSAWPWPLAAAALAMATIAPEDAARGADAEAAFQRWLDVSRLPYIYATQTRESVPAHFRGALKRPDFIVALPFAGALAFDVKSKTAYDGTLLFDADEVRRLAYFDDLFKISAFMACLDPEGSPRSLWFRVIELASCGKRKINGKIVHVVPTTAAITVDMLSPFQTAVADALSLK